MLGTNRAPILSLSMPTLDMKFKPIFKPILDPYEPSYALSSEQS
jgi:hypothetical protein